MKRSALVALAAVVAVAACQEIATSPQTADLDPLELRFSNPPPPPIDTGASGSVSPTFTQTIVQQRGFPAAPGFERFSGTPLSLQSSAFFTIPVTYMFDPAGNTGYLHFHSDADNDVETDAQGMVRLRGEDFIGQGFVTIETTEGTLVIDLSSVDDDASFFEACEQSVPSLTALDPRPDSLCFQVQFDDATLDGVPVGPVTLFPSCYPREENNFCNVVD